MCVLAFTSPVHAADPSFEISGHVNAALVFGGDVNDPEIVDNTASGSRLRLRASRDSFGGQRLSVRYEFQAQENNSFAANGGESFDTRYAEVGLKGGWGALSLGKGDGAANGTAESSYITSGNLFSGGHLPLFTVVGVLNRDNAANVGWTYYDAFSRVPRLRYDTPKFAGFTGAISLDSGDRQEYAVRYRGDVGPGKLNANLGIANSADGSNDRKALSFGYRLNSGFSASYSTNGRTQAAGPDLDSQLFSLNYQLNKWIFSVDLGDQGVNGETKLSKLDFSTTSPSPLSSMVLTRSLTTPIVHRWTHSS
jgi:predicted porin